jgi:hypothetical protein
MMVVVGCCSSVQEKETGSPGEDGMRNVESNVSKREKLNGLVTEKQSGTGIGVNSKSEDAGEGVEGKKEEESDDEAIGYIDDSIPISDSNRKLALRITCCKELFLIVDPLVRDNVECLRAESRQETGSSRYIDSMTSLYPPPKGQIEKKYIDASNRILETYYCLKGKKLKCPEACSSFHFSKCKK